MTDVTDDLEEIRDRSEEMSLALIEHGEEMDGDMADANHGRICDATRRVEAELARLETVEHVSLEIIGERDKALKKLAKTEAELARLTEGLANVKRDYDDVFGQLLRRHGDVHRAEAEVARLTENVRALDAEKHRQNEEVARLTESAKLMDDALVAAQRGFRDRDEARAEIARLRDGLRRIENLAAQREGITPEAYEDISDIARALVSPGQDNT